MELESILDSVKKLLGLGEDYDCFDADLVLCVNSALAILCQLGVGPEEGFRITGSNECWEDFLGDDKRLEAVKSYVAEKVRSLFDPPLSSAVMEAKSRITGEMEWRIAAAVELSDYARVAALSDGTGE